MPSIKIVLTLLALILSICRAAAAEASTPSYTIADLGTLGGKNCTAFALNNHSQIVGGSQTASGITHAFIWDHGKMEDLGVLPGDKTSVAYALNDKGQAVGSSDKSGTQPVLWDNRVIKKLPVGVGNIAFGIDEAGNVTGVVVKGDDPAAFVSVGGKVTIFGGPYSRGKAIAGGKAIGTFFTARDKAGMTYAHAFVWNAGHVRDLGLADVIGVNALNRIGQVVGMATVDYNLPPQKQHLEAFVWQDGKIRFLGRLRGSHLNSSACGINRGGAVVGWSHAKEGYAEAVLWQNGQIINLNSCTQMPHGYRLDTAQAINDQGQILCRGYTFTGNLKGGSFFLSMGEEIPGEVRHSFLLTPVAKPTVPPPTRSLSLPHDPPRHQQQPLLCSRCRGGG